METSLPKPEWKTLFDGIEYSEEAKTLDRQVEEILHDIAKDYVNRGYNIRDISLVIEHAAQTGCLRAVFLAKDIQFNNRNKNGKESTRANSQ